MLIVKLAYNNTQNTTIGYISFELNYDYHSYVPFVDKTNTCSISHLANKLAKKLKDLILICQ